MTPPLRIPAILVSCAAIFVALIVASCGHGGSVAPGVNQQHGMQNVTFHIIVPTPAPSSSPNGVHHHYVSQGTNTAGVTVTPQGGVPFPTTYFACTPAACTGTVSAPVGPDTFSVSLYGGSRISQDTLLSTGATVATIQPGVTNNVNVTFDPVVSSIALSVSPPNLPPGTPGTATVTVNATDATGNTIIGPGTYVNSAGASLTIDLSTVDILLNGHQGHSTSLSPTSLTGPPPSGPTQVTLTYDGNPQLASTTINASTTVPINGTITPAVLNVGASPSPSPTGCAVIATPQPTMTLYPVPTPTGVPVGPVGDSIGKGPDGNLWTSDGTRNVFQVTTAGKMKGFPVPGAGAGSTISSMTIGPAGGTTVWFADLGLRQLGRITTGQTPSITMFSVPDIEPPNQAQPAAISPGPDGNMWFTDRGSDYLGNIAPLLGSINEYPIPANSSRISQGVVVLPNGQLWFLESGLAKVGMVQISSLQLGTVNAVTEYPAGSSQPNELRNIAVSSDGNVWFTEPVTNKVARINVSAVPVTIDEFIVPAHNATPNGIAAGPDGAMWFTETSGRNLGRIPNSAPAGSSAVEFSYGLAAPEGIITGPDCALWVTDSSSPRGKVGQLKF